MSIVTWWPPSAKPSAWMKRPPVNTAMRGGAGAHVDHGGAEIGLVVGEHGQARHIGARHHRLDVEVAALDRQHQVARDRDVGGHDMHVDAELARQHAARIADAGGVVERVADRQRMQHGAAGARRMAAAGGEHARDVAVATIAEPATSIEADISSLPGRPAETDTTTDSSCSLAARSARSTAWRIAASAAARSITVPAFMPRARCGRSRGPRSSGCGGAARPAAGAA